MNNFKLLHGFKNKLLKSKTCFTFEENNYSYNSQSTILFVISLCFGKALNFIYHKIILKISEIRCAKYIKLNSLNFIVIN